MEKIESSARRVVKEIGDWATSYGRRAVDALRKIFKEVRNAMSPPSQTHEEGPYDESEVQSYLRILRAATYMHMDMAEVVSSKSFAAAFLTASVLDERLSRDRERLIAKVEVARDEAPIIHSTWSKLAEGGTCLMRRLEFASLDVESTCEVLEDVGKSLSEEGRLMKVHDSMLTYLQSGEASGLSELVYSALSSVIQDKRVEDMLCEYKGMLCEYITEHLCTLGVQLTKRSDTRGIRNEDIKNYVKKVLGDRGFLEYEVYSALLRQGIAAIPRLRFLTCNEEHEGTRLVEADVVAKVDDELWLVEVTTRRAKGDLEEKIEKYKELRNRIGASKVVFVGSPSMREQIEQLLTSKDFFYVQLDRLYSEIFKLLSYRAKR